MGLGNEIPRSIHLSKPMELCAILTVCQPKKNNKAIVVQMKCKL
jgi:hypothetical protein